MVPEVLAGEPLPGPLPLGDVDDGGEAVVLSELLIEPLLVVVLLPWLLLP